jgi:3-oxoadipate enol-lactonase
MTTPLHMLDEGKGPTIILAHALGCDLSMWDEVAQELVKGFRVIRFDQLGHGKSPAISGDNAISAFTDAVMAMIANLGLDHYLFAGVSMGAMVGMDLASRHPHKCMGVVLANTTHFYDVSSRLAWQKRIEAVIAGGMDSIADMALERWLSATFRKDNPNRVALLRHVLTGMHASGYVASCQAVSGIDFRDVLPSIQLPTLLIAGSQDVATPPVMLEHIHQQIARSSVTYVDAGHLSAVEKPREFATAVTQFYVDLQKNS